MKTFLFLHSFLFLTFVGANVCKGEVEIIAHRGASFVAPENTVASAKLGFEMKADAVEVDIWMTKDNRIVVIHDDNTSRTSGVDLKVPEALASEVRKIDVGQFKAEKYKGEKVPYLPEILNLIPEDKKIFVEIKHGEKILPYLFEMIERSPKKSQIIIIGFNLNTIAKFKEKMPEIPTYWLKGTDKDKTTQKHIPHDVALIKMAKEKNIDGLNLHYSGITEEFAKEVKKSGLKLYAWTVDDPQEAIRLVKLGIDGITTNKPDVIRDAVENIK